MTAKKTTPAKKPVDSAPAAAEEVSVADSGFSDDYTDQVLLAETQAQRSVCNVPDGDLPKALAKALARRVEVNLAQADGVTVTRVGGSDPEVRDLESPYSKRKPSGSA